MLFSFFLFELYFKALHETSVRNLLFLEQNKTAQERKAQQSVSRQLCTLTGVNTLPVLVYEWLVCVHLTQMSEVILLKTHLFYNYLYFLAGPKVIACSISTIFNKFLKLADPRGELFC